MGKGNRHIAKKWFLLVLFASYVTGILFFTHTHVINRITYIHSHPFKTDGKARTLFPTSICPDCPNPRSLTILYFTKDYILLKIKPQLSSELLPQLDFLLFLRNSLWIVSVFTTGKIFYTWRQVGSHGNFQITIKPTKKLFWFFSCAVSGLFLDRFEREKQHEESRNK